MLQIQPLEMRQEGTKERGQRAQPGLYSLVTLLFASSFLTAQDSLQRAREALQARHYSEAIQLLRQELERSPNNAHVHSLLAVALDQTGRYPEAEKHHLQAIRLAPRREEFHNNLALHYLRRSRQEEAVQAFERATALNPGSATAHYNLARLYLNRSHFEKALAHARAAARATPHDLEIQITHIQALVLNGQNDEAKKAIRGLPPSLGNHTDFLAALSEAWMRAEEWVEAEVVLRRGLETHAADFEFLRRLGHVLLRQGRFEESIASLERSLALSENPQSRIDLGWAYFYRERYEEASRQFRQAAATAPENVLALLSRAHMLARAYQGKEVEEVAERIIRLAPENPFGYYYLGLGHEYQGRSSQAAGAFQKASTLAPDFSLAWFHLGQAQAMEGKHDSAIKSLNRAAELNPQNAQTFLLLSRSLQELGKEAEARAALERYRSLEAGKQEEPAFYLVPP